MELEILVPERCGATVRDRIVEAFPGVEVLPVDPTTSIPDMRARAFEAATGQAVAVIEDHVVVPPDWARSLLEAWRAGAKVVGGGVENLATERLVDRAAYYCEYSQLIPPLEAGPAEWLTGNNTLYDRALLERYSDAVGNGQWDDVLHDALRSDGVTLNRCPDIVVGHKMHYTFGEYMAQRFLYSRSYAGARCRSSSPLGRAWYAGRSLALPPVLLTRIVRRVWTRPELRTDLVRSLPFLVAFVSSWALGEIVGALFGPGRSLERVR